MKKKHRKAAKKRERSERHRSEAVAITASSAIEEPARPLWKLVVTYTGSPAPSSDLERERRRDMDALLARIVGAVAGYLTKGAKTTFQIRRSTVHMDRTVRWLQSLRDVSVSLREISTPTFDGAFLSAGFSDMTEDGFVVGPVSFHRTLIRLPIAKKKLPKKNAASRRVAPPRSAPRTTKRGTP